MNQKLAKACEDVIEEFVCCQYDVKGIKSVNEACYQIFFGKKKVPEPQKLLPKKDWLTILAQHNVVEVDPMVLNVLMFVHAQIVKTQWETMKMKKMETSMLKAKMI